MKSLQEYLENLIDQGILQFSQTYFIHDPYRLFDTPKNDLELFNEIYSVHEHTSDLEIRDQLEEAKGTNKRYVVVSHREQVDTLKDFIYRAVFHKITPTSLLKQQLTGKYAKYTCPPDIDKIGVLYRKYEKDLIATRKRYPKVLTTQGVPAYLLESILGINLQAISPALVVEILYRQLEDVKEDIEKVNLKEELVKLALQADKEVEKVGMILANVVNNKSGEREIFPLFLFGCAELRRIKLLDDFYKVQGLIGEAQMQALFSGIAPKSYEWDAVLKRLADTAEELVSRDPCFVKSLIEQVEERYGENIKTHFSNFLSESSTPENILYFKTALKIELEHISKTLLEGEVPGSQVRAQLAKLDDHLFTHSFLAEKMVIENIGKFLENLSALESVVEKQALEIEDYYRYYAERYTDLLSLLDLIEGYRFEDIIAEDSRSKIDEILKRFFTLSHAMNLGFAEKISDSYPSLIEESRNSKAQLTKDFLTFLFSTNYEEIKNAKRLIIFVFDALRYDIWKRLQTEYSEKLQIVDQAIMLSLLPSITQLSRTAIFSGKYPSDVLTWNDRYTAVPAESEEKLFDLALPLDAGKKPSLRFFDDKTIYENPKEVRQAITGGDKIVVLLVRDIDKKIHNPQPEMLWETIDLTPAIKKLLDLAAEDPGDLIAVCSDHGYLRVKDKYKDIPGSQALGKRHHRFIDIKDTEVLDKIPNWQENFVQVNAKEWRIDKEERIVLIAKGIDFIPVGEQRYVHGGISMEEMIVPCALLRPIVSLAEMRLDIEIEDKELIVGKATSFKVFVRNRTAGKTSMIRLHGPEGQTKEIDPLGPYGVDFAEFEATSYQEAQLVEITPIYKINDKSIEHPPVTKTLRVVVEEGKPFRERAKGLDELFKEGD